MGIARRTAVLLYLLMLLLLLTPVESGLSDSNEGKPLLHNELQEAK